MAYAKWRQLLAIVKCLIAFGGAVDEIVQNHNVAGLDVLLQRTSGSGDNYMRASDVLQGPHIGPIVYVRRHNGMLATVPCQEHTIDAIYFAIDQNIGNGTCAWSERREQNKT